MPAEFLLQLAPRRNGIILARVDMPAAGGIPTARKGVLAHAAPLEEEAAIGIVHQDVNGAMEELLRVDLTARRPVDGAVVEVDHIEKLVRIRGFDGLGRKAHGDGGEPGADGGGCTISILT